MDIYSPLKILKTMGGDRYNLKARSARAVSMNYMAADVDQVFTQNTKREVHQDMTPKGLAIREARDSDVHPNSFPIILGLDVTGSMHTIPHELVKEGLPHMMAKLMKAGVQDAALCFVAIGDTNVDSTPLQVGQFESGDEKLDHWLTSTYLEGGGGGNGGESYMLAWYFANYHTVTDAWEKRKKKGLIITTGDERCHAELPATAVKRFIGAGAEASFNSVELLKKAQEKWDVYHLQIMEGQEGKKTLPYWKELLGDHCIQVDDHKKVGDIIANIVIQHAGGQVAKPTKKSESKEDKKKEEEEML